jgi:hypothetical protein
MEVEISGNLFEEIFSLLTTSQRNPPSIAWAIRRDELVKAMTESRKQNNKKCQKQNLAL